MTTIRFAPAALLALALATAPAVGARRPKAAASPSPAADTTALHAWHLKVAAAAAAARNSVPEFQKVARVEDRRDGDNIAFERWFGDPDRRTRERAILAAGRCPTRRYRTRLLAMLEAEDSTLRVDAAFAIGLTADSTLLYPLSDAIKDGCPSVRATVVEAISRLGTRRGAAYLAGALSDPSPDVQVAALTGLWRLQDSSGVDATLPFLRSGDPRLRRHAVYALERSHSFRAPAAIRPLQSDADEEVRMWAVRSAGRMKDFASESLLVTRLRDPSWRVRVNAAVALGQLADSARGPALVASLSDSSAYVRRVAADALGQVGFCGAVRALGAMVSDSSQGCRGSAAVALARILGPWAHAACEPFLKDTVDIVQAQTLVALGGAHSASDWKFAAWAAEKAVPRLQDAAIQYFGEMKDGHGMVWVMEAMASDDPVVASTAAGVVEDSGDSLRVPELEQLYERWPKPENPEPRMAAVSALAKLAPKGELGFFRRALRDDDRRVRALAAAAILAVTGQAVPDSVLNAPLPESRRGWFDALPDTLPDHADLETNRGHVVIRLQKWYAPNTVANFISLAKSGYFTYLMWHRVVPNFVIQGGDPHGDGEGGPGYTIRDEFNVLHYDTGAVGMALSGKDTGGSQFFITQSPQPHLDGKYTIFGHVESGMDVVDRLDVGDVILTVRIY